MPLRRLAPAAWNPRRISPENLAALRASLVRFGLVQPIVWNRRSGRVVGGHQRLKVLAEAGVPDADVVVVDLSAAAEKALNVALNAPTAQGEFDDAALAQVLDGLAGGEALGFDRLLEDLGQLPANISVAPPLPPPPKLVWAVVGLPVAALGDAQPHLDAVRAVPGCIMEMSVGDAEN